MDKLVVFNLGEGDFKQGFPVTLQVWEEGGFLTSFVGKLPASAIDFLYDKWQSDYRQKISGRMIPTPGRVSNYSDTDLTGNSHILKAELNNWLNSETFRPVRDKFLTTVKSKHTVRVIIQTENPQLRRLPWYLWDLFVKNYPLAEMALSSPTFERVEKSVQPKPKVRILAILGDSSPPDPQTGIRLDINADKQFLENLPDAETVFLVEPKRHEFNEKLWDERGWDILFFAGHTISEPDGTTGKIYINPTEYLTIDDLKFALKEAIYRGLQLAIFNSCDGLGIARDLAELQIPQIIAMREPVADLVAKEFLKYFLDSFSKGQDLYLAVRKARERLQGLETDFPCASWLPVIFQNPAANPVNWQGLRGIATGINWRDACQRTIPERGKLTSNSLVVNDGLNLNVDDVYVPLGLVERKHTSKREKDIQPEQGSQFYEAETQYEVTKTFKNDEFFGEVLKQGKTDKSKGKRIAIIGEPGAGKTTLLQKIADWVLAETEVVPIWVSLADLGKFSLEDYLLQKWLKLALNVADVTAQMRQDLVMLFNNHQVWLLLDAADEMSAGNPLDEIKSQLRGWIAEARVVLTCRYNVWDAGKNALADFDVYRNLDFDEEEQIPLFIRSVFQQSDLGERLCQKLAESENARLRDTVKNPLRLTLLCLAWHIRQGDFTTKTQADLYAQFTEAVYEWKREKFPTTSQQRRELNKALAALALRGMEEDESRFRLRQGWVREVLGEADEPLCELALQLGWINRVGVAAERPEEQVYAFYHPTFQEYFAALGVDDWGYFLRHVPDNPGLGIYRIFEKQWKQVILLWFGREDVEKEKKEEFIDGLVEFQDGCGNFYKKYQAYFLAAAGIAEFKTCKRSQEIVAQIVHWAYGYFNADKDTWVTFFPPIEEGAEAVLAETDRQRAIARLIQLLDETSSEDTRWSVANSLGKIAVGNEEAIARLIQLLDETSNEDTRKRVAEIFGNIAVENEGAIARLIQLLDETSNEFTRRYVAESLSNIAVGNEAAITRLIQLLDETSDECTRGRVAESLGKIVVGHEGAIPCLIQLLNETSDEYARGRVAESLGNIAVENERAIACLFQLLEQTSDENIIHNVTGSLSKIGVGNEGLIARLIQVLEQIPDEYISAASLGLGKNVAWTLSKIAVGNKGAISRLIQVLETTSNEYTICYVAEILGKIKVDNDRFIARLIQLLETQSNGYLSRMIQESLGQIAVGNESAIARLIQLLDETSDEYTRRSVAESLGQIAVGNESAIARLIQLLDQTSNEYTRQTVAESLGKITVGNESAIACLIQLLDETLNKYTRQIVAKSLGKIIATKQQYFQVILAFKFHLVDEIYKNNFDVYKQSYKLLWQCAQNMTYLQYYTAWNHQFRNSNEIILDNTIICPACTYYNPKGNEFCDACGYDLATNWIAVDNTITCPVCSYKNSEGSEFCDVCGNELGVTLPNQTSNDTIICPYCIYDNPNRNEFCDACGYDLATNWIAVDNTITCPVCGHKNSEGSEFCDVCGNELGVTLPTQTLNDTIICQACSYDNPNGNEFCDACGYELPVIVSYNFEDTLDPLIQSLENKITPNFSQLQPTPQTYPLPINIQSLTDETDTSAICQELCTQIYYLALPDTDIPTANNFAQLKRHILTAKRQLQKRHLALILHECEPDSTLITCCRKIADANLGLHIAWITDTPLDAPLRGFPPQQPNLLGALQTWINELS